jgi:hypothetical protein
LHDVTADPVLKRTGYAQFLSQLPQPVNCVAVNRDTFLEALLLAAVLQLARQVNFAARLDWLSRLNLGDKLLQPGLKLSAGPPLPP